MTIFIALPKDAAGSAALRAAVEREFPNNYLALDLGAYLISAKGTPIEISNRIGVTSEKGHSTIVFATSGYWGRAPATTWDWLKAKLETPSNG